MPPIFAHCNVFSRIRLLLNILQGYGPVLVPVVIAVLFASRANPSAGLVVLLGFRSQQVQHPGRRHGWHIQSVCGRYTDFPSGQPPGSAEFLLTAAQALFALLLIARCTLNRSPGVALLAAFIAHMFSAQEEHHLWMALSAWALPLRWLSRTGAGSDYCCGGTQK